MIVLSLFDGLSCGRLALYRAGIKVDKYYASEIDKYASSIARYNWPDNIELGDVTKWQDWDIDWSSIDLLIGGSPCQSFSVAGKGEGFAGKSGLFYEYVAILDNIRYHNPDIKFLLENVKMKAAWRDTISQELGVEPVLINSARLSAQNRERYYWCNWAVSQPDDKGIILADVLEDDAIFKASYSICLQPSHACFNSPEHRTFTGKSPTIRPASGGGHLPYALKTKEASSYMLSQKERLYMDKEVKGGRNHWDFKHHSDTDNNKSAAVVANFFKGVPYNVLIDRRNAKCYMEDCDFQDTEFADNPGCDYFEGDNYQNSGQPTSIIRKFTPLECERLQTLPDNHTAFGFANGNPVKISNTARYKAIGNGWTVDVIAHILRQIK